MRLKYLLPFLVPCVGACGTPSSCPSPNSGPTPVEIDAQDVSSSFERSFVGGTYVFHSQTELDDAWALAPFEVYSGGSGTEPTKPTYDFSTQMVVGYSRGVGPRCFFPTITLVERADTNTIVHYVAPNKTSLGCLDVRAPLVAFAVVSRADGDVSFVQDPND